MCSLLTTLGVLLLATAGNVTCSDDFDFTCPEEWKNGTVEQLVCTIPLNKLTSPVPCDTYTDTVDFYIIPGNGIPSCSVRDFDTTCNNNYVGDCGCQERNATHVTFVYKVTAAKNLHENARWNCVPQCLDSSLDPAITARNTSQCFQTKFETTTTATPTTTESVPPTSSTSSPANPCSGQTCGYGTQENKPGCPCDCYPFWDGTHCTDFCWWCLLLILLAAVLIIICCLCYYCANVEVRCCCEGCWMRCYGWACVLNVFCYEHVATNWEDWTGEEVQCKCVYRKRQHSGDGNSEPLNRMEPVKDGDLDGTTAAEQPKPAVSSAPVSNSDHTRKPPGGQPAPEAPSDPTSNPVPARKPPGGQPAPEAPSDPTSNPVPARKPPGHKAPSDPTSNSVPARQT